MNAPRTRWRRVSLGLYLVGIGAFLLLTSLDRLSWTYWFDVAAFWPVVLVALGIRVLFERSRTPALVLLSPALVLGTMAYVALRPLRPWQGHWVPVRAERPEGLDDWTFSARLLRAELDISTRDLPSDVLVDGRAGCERGQVTLRSRGERDRHRVEARSAFRSWPWVPAREKWELHLARQLPLRASFHGAFNQGRLDLTGVPVNSLELHGAFHDLVIQLDEPGQDVRLEVHGAFNHLRLIVPATTRVDVRSRGALQSVDNRATAASTGRAAYTVELHGFMNSLDVESPAPSSPPPS
jgi:hypothetical protein